MLVLCSNGLSSEMLLTHIRSKIVGCKTSALVVTADNEYKEYNVNVIRINDGEGVFIDEGVHICKV